MEAQGSVWSARERTVIAKMENNLDKSDDMKLGELDLMYILTHARRQQFFFSSRSSVRKRKVTTWWQAETVGWSTKDRGSSSKRGRKAICAGQRHVRELPKVMGCSIEGPGRAGEAMSALQGG